MPCRIQRDRFADAENSVALTSGTYQPAQAFARHEREPRERKLMEEARG